MPASMLQVSAREALSRGAKLPVGSAVDDAAAAHVFHRLGRIGGDLVHIQELAPPCRPYSG